MVPAPSPPSPPHSLRLPLFVTHTRTRTLLRFRPSIRQALARSRVEDLEGLVAFGEERVAAANAERNEAIELRDKTQKDLDLKTFSLKKSQRMAALEQRTTVGMRKKTEMLEDDLLKEKRQHEITEVGG
jgi:hypothetical protein